MRAMSYAECGKQGRKTLSCSKQGALKVSQPRVGLRPDYARSAEPSTKFRGSRPNCSGVTAGDEIGPFDLALDNVAAEGFVHFGCVFHIVEDDACAASGQRLDRADRNILAAAFGDHLLILEAHIDGAGHGNFGVTVKNYVGLRRQAGA